MKDWLEIAANAASVITALVVVFIFCVHQRGLYQRRKQLVGYLKEDRNNQFGGWHNPTYLMAALGFTEDQVFEAALNNGHIERRPGIEPDPNNPKVGRAIDVKFRYKLPNSN
jgi:hypothetical protein